MSDRNKIQSIAIDGTDRTVTLSGGAWVQTASMGFLFYACIRQRLPIFFLRMVFQGIFLKKRSPEELSLKKKKKSIKI